MTKPWLSVVMPVHNGERWLDATLRSLADQRDRDFECILVDSSDLQASLEIAGRFATKLKIDAHRRPDLVSWQEKTNYAVTLARADHIAMLHQDDLWLSNRSQLLRRQLEASSDAVLRLYPSLIVDERGRALGLWRCPLPAGETAVPRDRLLERLLVQNFVALPAPVIRRDAYLAVQGLDTALWYTADWDLYLKLTLMGPVRYCDEPTTAFRIHGESLTMTGGRQARSFTDQLETVLRRYEDKAPPAGRAAALRAARASIEVNAALSAAAHGDKSGLIPAFASILALGPLGTWRYLRDSRLIERLAPRLRARLAGAL